MAEKFKNIRVRAIKLGFYIGRRKPDDEFDIPENQFSDVWMEKIKTPIPIEDDAAAAKAKAKAKAKAETKGIDLV